MNSRDAAYEENLAQALRLSKQSAGIPSSSNDDASSTTTNTTLVDSQVGPDGAIMEPADQTVVLDETMVEEETAIKTEIVGDEVEHLAEMDIDQPAIVERDHSIPTDIQLQPNIDPSIEVEPHGLKRKRSLDDGLGGVTSYVHSSS